MGVSKVPWELLVWFFLGSPETHGQIGSQRAAAGLWSDSTLGGLHYHFTLKYQPLRLSGMPHFTNILVIVATGSCVLEVLFDTSNPLYLLLFLSLQEVDLNGDPWVPLPSDLLDSARHWLDDWRVGEWRSEGISSPNTLSAVCRLAMAACLCQRPQLLPALSELTSTFTWFW